MSRTFTKAGLRRPRSDSWKWLKTNQHKRFRHLSKTRLKAGRQLLPVNKNEFKAKWGLCGLGEEHLRDALPEVLKPDGEADDCTLA